MGDKKGGKRALNSGKRSKSTMEERWGNSVEGMMRKVEKAERRFSLK